MKKTTQLKIDKTKVPYIDKYVPTIQIISGTLPTGYTNNDLSEIEFEYDTRDFELIMLQVFYAGIMYKSENK